MEYDQETESFFVGISCYLLIASILVTRSNIETQSEIISKLMKTLVSLEKQHSATGCPHYKEHMHDLAEKTRDFMSNTTALVACYAISDVAHSRFVSGEIKPNIDTQAAATIFDQFSSSPLRKLDTVLQIKDEYRDFLNKYRTFLAEYGLITNG